MLVSWPICNAECNDVCSPYVIEGCFHDCSRIPNRGICWLNCILVFVAGKSQCVRVSHWHHKHRGASGASEWHVVCYSYDWHVCSCHIMYQYDVAFHISQRLCSGWPKPAATPCLWDTPHWYERYNWIRCWEANSGRCVCVCVCVCVCTQVLITMAPDIFIQVPEVWAWGAWEV